MEPSDYTVEELIEMLKAMPKDAKLVIEYRGYYEGCLVALPLITEHITRRQRASGMNEVA